MIFSCKEQSPCFSWIIIGDGDDKRLIQNEIRRNQVENEVHLIGAKDNPYPYIRAASLVICPSYSEACPVVVHEAKILHVPVVTADFPSASEFITNGDDGYICPINEIGHKIIDLYTDKFLYTNMKKRCETFYWDNSSIINQVYNLIDD